VEGGRRRSSEREEGARRSGSLLDGANVTLKEKFLVEHGTSAKDADLRLRTGPCCVLHSPLSRSQFRSTKGKKKTTPTKQQQRICGKRYTSLFLSFSLSLYARSPHACFCLLSPSLPPAVGVLLDCPALRLDSHCVLLTSPPDDNDDDCTPPTCSQVLLLPNHTHDPCSSSYPSCLSRCTYHALTLQHLPTLLPLSEFLDSGQSLVYSSSKAAYLQPKQLSLLSRATVDRFIRTR
jgi:hypothetical protein